MVTGLAQDMEMVLAPLRKLGERLSVAERYLIEKQCDEVLAMCREEEKQAEVTVDLIHELEERLEDQ
jgi:hypothetical protein